MRNSLILFVLLSFALGPALPATAVAEGPLLAQASKKSKKSKKSKDDASKEAETAETADAADSDEAAAKAAESTKAASDEAEKAAAAADSADAPAEATDADSQPAEESPNERVPLTANFSKAEIITAGSAYVGGMGLLLFGPDIFGAPTASLDTPQVGSFDYRVSSRFHGDLVDPGKFLFGVPDYTGLIAFPVGGSLFYLGSAAYYWGTGDTLFGQSVNIDHSAIGFIEALGWTALATGVTKQLIGRERPYKALARPEFGDVEDPDSNLSFFSGHTSISFVSASYMALDLSDHLMKNGASWWTGTFLPYLGLYGMASLVGVSRVFDQKHYASDVLIGALVGSLIGNLTYVAHFDEDGDPRVRNPEALADVEVSVGPITTPSGAQGVGFIGSW